MEGDSLEIQDGSAKFEVRSIPDMYKEIQQLKQLLTPTVLPFSDNKKFGVKIGNLVIVSFDGYPNGTEYPSGWGVSLGTLDIGYKAKTNVFASIASQSSTTNIYDDGNIIANIAKGSSTISFKKFSGNGEAINYWARGQIIIPIEE